MRRLIVAPVLLLAIGVACVAERTSPAEQAHAVEAQVWSPYCPGRLLVDCTTRQARELRAEIEGRFEAGQGTDEVLRWIRLNYGDEALARPSAANALIVWSFPAAVGLFGAAILTVLIRRWARSSDEEGVRHAGT